MVRQHRITVAVVITLGLTASLVPSASADPAPLAKAEAAIAATHGSALVRPKPNEHAAPSTPSVTEASCGDVCSGHGYGNVDVVPLSPRVRPTSTAADNGGFDWGDAGAGAGASLVLLAIGLTGARVATSSRKRHAREQRVIATS